MPDNYSRAKPTESSEERFKRTVDRLNNIRQQLESKPRGTKLAGQVCIITGVGSLKGIGRATAFAYAHEGAKHLYLSDFAGENLPELQKTLSAKYPDTKVDVIQGDAADEKLISDLCTRAISEEGRLDVFFANAGIATTKILGDITSDAFMNVMKVNVLSCFLAIKHASEAMKKTSPAKPASRGSIILTASVAGLRSGAGTIDYSASKAAVNNLAKTSAYQLAHSEIRVNSICPGLIETGMTVTTFDYARSRNTGHKIGQLNPLGRYGVPSEIAQAALFLASDDSSYVNGQNLAVDGGLSSSHPVMPGRWA